MKATITKKNSVKRTLAGILATIALATAIIPTAASTGFFGNDITASAMFLENRTDERKAIDKYLEELSNSNSLSTLLNINASTNQATKSQIFRDKEGNVYSIYRTRKGANGVETTSMDSFGIDSSLRNVFYPGSLLVADEGMLTGAPTTVKLQRRETEVTISDAKMAPGCDSCVRVNPTRYSGVQNNVAKLIDNIRTDEDFPAQAVTYIEQVESEQQIKAQLNLSEKLWGDLKISASADYQNKTQTVILDSRQKFFTLSADNNISSADLFSDDVTLDDVKEAMRDKNGNVCSAAYVSSVDYGKRVLACIQTDDMSFELKSKVETAFAGEKVKGDLSVEDKEKLSKCSVKLIVIGGASGKAGEYIKAGANMTELLNAISSNTKYDGNAAPISFSICDAFSGTPLTKNYTGDAWETVISPVRSAVKTTLCFGGIDKNNAIHSKTINIYGKKIKDVDENGNYVYGDEEKLFTKTAYADGTIDWTLGADVDFGSVRIEFLHDAEKIDNGKVLFGLNIVPNGGISAPFKQCIYLKNLVADTEKTGDIDKLVIGATDIGTKVGNITIMRSDDQAASESSTGLHMELGPRGLSVDGTYDAKNAKDMLYQPQIGFAAVQKKLGNYGVNYIDKIVKINNY